MSPEKGRELVATFPEIFSDDPNNLVSMFSFECNDGWYDLLKELLLEIKAICEQKGFGPDDECRDPLKVNQVKEKYGTLRFYTSWTTDAIENAIKRAEEKSSVTCEDCGAPGKVKAVRPHWYKCICEKCIRG